MDLWATERDENRSEQLGLWSVDFRESEAEGDRRFRPRNYATNFGLTTLTRGRKMIGVPGVQAKGLRVWLDGKAFGFPAIEAAF
jgi:hypothetical protein